MSEALNTGSFRWDDTLCAAYRTPRNCSRSILMRSGANVRFGSEADMCSAQAHVRFTPNSGHVQCDTPCLLWAKSRLMHRSKKGPTEADMCAALAHVRFTPKADICSAVAYVRFGPIADIWQFIHYGLEQITHG